VEGFRGKGGTARLKEVALLGTAAEVAGLQEMEIVGAVAEELELQEEFGGNDGARGAILASSLFTCFSFQYIFIYSICYIVIVESL